MAEPFVKDEDRDAAEDRVNRKRVPKRMRVRAAVVRESRTLGGLAHNRMDPLSCLRESFEITLTDCFARRRG